MISYIWWYWFHFNKNIRIDIIKRQFQWFGLIPDLLGLNCRCLEVFMSKSKQLKIGAGESRTCSIHFCRLVGPELSLERRTSSPHGETVWLTNFCTNQLLPSGQLVGLASGGTGLPVFNTSWVLSKKILDVFFWFRFRIGREREQIRTRGLGALGNSSSFFFSVLWILFGGGIA